MSYTESGSAIQQFAWQALPVYDPCGMEKVQATGHVKHDAAPTFVPCQVIRVIPVERVTQIATLPDRQYLMSNNPMQRTKPTRRPACNAQCLLGMSSFVVLSSDAAPHSTP